MIMISITFICIETFLEDVPQFNFSLIGNLDAWDQTQLNCTTLNDSMLGARNITVRWTRNLINSIPSQNNTINVSSPGFYCCQVDSEQNFTACATVVVIVGKQIALGFRVFVTVLGGKNCV